jgi:hypothetical protein
MFHCYPHNIGINTFGDCVLTSICSVPILGGCLTAIPDLPSLFKLFNSAFKNCGIDKSNWLQ